MFAVFESGLRRALCAFALAAVSVSALAELPAYRVVPVLRPVPSGGVDMFWYAGVALNNDGTMVVHSFQYANPFSWFETHDKKGGFIQFLGGQSKYGTAYFSGINRWGDVVGSESHDWGVMKGEVLMDRGFGANIYGFNEDDYGGYFSDAWAYGLSDSGHVVGQATGSRDGRVRAYVWRGGVQQELGTFGGATSSAVAVNNRGHAVGTADLPDGSYHAFVFRKGLMRDLGTLGGALSWASAVNDAGQVVGGAQLADGSSRAFVHAKGQLAAVPTPEGAGASAWAVNGSGVVLGSYTTDRPHPFLFDGQRVYRLEELLSDTDRAHWTLSGAAAINDKGWVLCDGRRAGDEHDSVLLLKPVVSPAAFGP